MLLAGCATTAYRPSDPCLWAIVAPGAPQYINGEPMKGLAVDAAFVGGGLLSSLFQNADGSIKQGGEPYSIAGGMLSLAAWIYSGVDGHLSAVKRIREWDKTESDMQIIAASAFQEAVKNSSYTEQEKRAILVHGVFVGMSRGALIMSMGQPVDINTSVTANTRDEQFVYSMGKYVYIENGTVTAYQF
jgi:hypothetical protein